MSLIDKIYITLTSKFIGTDEFGNKYYESRLVKDSLNDYARYVIYSGINEPSKVPPLWNMWIRHLSDEAPSNDSKLYKWQRSFVPNLTGTKFVQSYNNQSNKKNYVPWVPKEGL